MEDWINSKYLGESKVKDLKAKFNSARPFEHLALPDFFIAEKGVDLLKELANEQFIDKESDLFKIKQTHDIASSKSKLLGQFKRFLSSADFISYMQSITGLKLKNTVDLAGNVYEDTDFLLCHDDRLEGRKIAFMLYLSDLNAKDGGALNLYSSTRNLPHKIVKKIRPKFNSFVFFKVSPKSFHSVSEVTSVKQRITFNGWFHG